MSRRSDTQDWQRLSEAVRERRETLGMTQQDVQAAGGPAVATMRILEGARQENYRGVILSRLEKALRWTPGSVQRVLGGGDPTPIEDMHSGPAMRPGDAGMKLQVVDTHTNSPPGSKTRDFVEGIRARAQAEGRSLGEVLVADGLADPEELVIPDSLAPDPIIRLINNSDATDEEKMNLIRMHLENRAARFEQERLAQKKRKKLDG